MSMGYQSLSKYLNMCRNIPMKARDVPLRRVRWRDLEVAVARLILLATRCHSMPPSRYHGTVHCSSLHVEEGASMG